MNLPVIIVFLGRDLLQSVSVTIITTNSTPEHFPANLFAFFLWDFFTNTFWPSLAGFPWDITTRLSWLEEQLKQAKYKI